MSPTTINSAWRLLRATHVIQTRRRGGTFVSGMPRPARPVRFEQLTTTVDAGQFVLDLSRLLPDAAFLPDLGPALVQAAALPETNRYQPALITDLLRERVAGGWPFRAEAFLATNGGYDALALLARGLLGVTDTVAIEEPTSGRLLDIIDAVGAEAIPVHCDDQGPNPESLRAALAQRPSAVFFQTRAQSPTGYSLTEQRAQQLVDLLADSDAVVVENDSQAGIVECPDVSLGRWLPERTVHVHSFSKSYGPDLRLGVIGGAAGLVERARLIRSYDAGWTSRLIQNAGGFLMSDQRVGEQIAAGRAAYGQRRQALAEGLARHGVHSPSRDGMALWLPVRSETAALAVLASHGIAVQPGSRAFARPQDAQFIRVSAGRLTSDYPAVAAWIAGATQITWDRLGHSPD